MAGKNRITRTVAPKSIFESAISVISSAVSFDQGDLLVFDDTNNRLKKPTAEAEGSTFVGIAQCSISSGKLLTPYVTDVDAAQAISDIPGPVYGVIAKLVLKTGDSINPGDDVYLDPASGSYHVSVTGTKSIGLYQGGALSSVAAGTQIEVLLGARAKNDVLKF